ncbi:MAG: hypothetical protein V7K26_28510 [Nostoc sp.]|uniref:hypothetical protein n=2 Tax=Nostoc sp. TaxID=1180 RepID=UPI002FEEAE6D
MESAKLARRKSFAYRQIYYSWLENAIAFSKPLGTEVRSLGGKFIRVSRKVRSHLRLMTKRRSLIGRFIRVAWKVRSHS